MRRSCTDLITAFVLTVSLLQGKIAHAQNACDVISLSRDSPTVIWSPDGSKYLVNKPDTAGVFQVYVGNRGDTATVCISDKYSNGNCCGLFRPWDVRNKMQAQW